MKPLHLILLMAGLVLVVGYVVSRDKVVSPYPGVAYDGVSNLGMWGFLTKGLDVIGNKIAAPASSPPRGDDSYFDQPGAEGPRL